MKTIGRLALPLRTSLIASVAAAVLGQVAPAWGQANCYPACAAGQVCVQGTCMVPAPPPQNYPQAAPVAPPPADQQPAAGPPPQGAYPPPQGTYPPPQGAYPPPAGQYPPPQGYAYPPPGAGGYPPPPPPGPPPRRGFLAMPFLGINSFLGSTGDDLGVGFRIGALLGGRLSETFSLNGELTIDVMNPKNVPANIDVSAVQAVLAFSPLVHIPSGNIEFVLGPKLGFFGYAASQTSAGITDEYSASGIVIGLNAGLFGAVSPGMSIGGLISLDIRNYNEVCSKPSGFEQTCSSASADQPDADKVFGLAGALLF